MDIVMSDKPTDMVGRIVSQVRAMGPGKTIHSIRLTASEATALTRQLEDHPDPEFTLTPGFFRFQYGFYREVPIYIKSIRKK